MRKFLSVITIGSMLMTGAFCGCSQQNQSSPASGAATANDSKTSSPASADSSAYTSAAGSENSAGSSGKKVRVNDSALGQIWINELEGVKKKYHRGDKLGKIYADKASLRYQTGNRMKKVQYWSLLLENVPIKHLAVTDRPSHRKKAVGIVPVIKRIERGAF